MEYNFHIKCVTGGYHIYNSEIEVLLESINNSTNDRFYACKVLEYLCVSAVHTTNGYFILASELNGFLLKLIEVDSVNVIITK